MLSGTLDVLNREQLRNKSGFYKSLSTGDGGGGTCVANHGIPTNDLFSSKLLIPLFSQYLIKLCKRSMYQVIPDSVWFFSTISLFNNVVNNNFTKNKL
jgi:hypothetical protein